MERHITEVLECHMGTRGRAGRERARELLASVGLESSAAGRYPHELSGGQKQRAALAIALACEPDFLLADEPTTALDVITQRGVLETIAGSAREHGMGLLLVTHDLPLAAEVCARLIVMKDGEFVESGPSPRVTRAPEHPYAKRLLSSIREMEEA
jgi:ABC-type glutathione transport system ATPase component